MLLVDALRLFSNACRAPGALNMVVDAVVLVVEQHLQQRNNPQSQPPNCPWSPLWQSTKDRV
jgi:hypothetical protein